MDFGGFFVLNIFHKKSKRLFSSSTIRDKGVTERSSEHLKYNITGNLFVQRNAELAVVKIGHWLHPLSPFE